MGGHSSFSQTGSGWWVPLRARAIWLQDADGDVVAIVSTDLWAVPAGLGDRIAERLRQRGGETGNLGRSRLLLAATHTHTSPGNFSPSPTYTALAQRAAGFDRSLFRFLSERICDAIETAAAARRPASVAVGALRAPRLMRNRSLEPFLLNPEATEVLAGNADLPCGPATCVTPDPRSYRAIDPVVRVLRFDHMNGPAAVIAVAAAHPTGLGNQCRVYSGDAFGTASYLCETGSSPVAPVVALLNGAEGDVSLDWTAQDASETLRLGAALADAVRQAASSAVRAGEDVESSHEVAPFAAQEFRATDGRIASTPSWAAVGLPMTGGAEDGRSPLHATPACREGVISGPLSAGPHGRKAVVGGFLGGPLIGLVLSPPSDLPLAVHTVGGVRLACVPGEFTTVAGLRVRRAIAEASGAAEESVWIVGPANDYCSYFATHEEYQAQHYEGASTLWGEDAADLAAVRLARLSTVAGRCGGPDEPYSHFAGLAGSWGPDDVAVARGDPGDELRAAVGAEGLGAGLPHFTWTGPAAALPDSGMIGATGPHVRVQRWEQGDWRDLVIDGRPADSRGTAVAVLLLKPDDGDSKWGAIWLTGGGESGRYRYVAVNTDGSSAASSAFEVLR